MKRYIKARLKEERRQDPVRSVRNNLLILSAFIISAILVYINSIRNPFIWDDQYLIINNHFIKDTKFIFESFRHHLYYSTAGMSNFYRPLQTIFLMLDYSIWGLSPSGYHITSIIFHILTAFLAYLFVSFMFKDRKVAFLLGFLFLVHPVNSTVVDYISSRADSQAVFFILLTFLSFTYSVEISSRSGLLYISSLCSFMLALLSKELAVVTPFLLLAVILILYKNIPRKTILLRILPFFIIFGIYILLRLTVLNFTTHPFTGPDLYIRLLTTCESFVRLILLQIVPYRIHIEKSIPFSAGLFQLSTFISVIIILIIGLFIYWVKRHSIKCFLGLVWFFISLLPMSNIMPINATLADHWLYLPCIGFFLAVIGGINDLIERLSPNFQISAKRAALGIYIAIAVIFSFLTIRQNTIWKDPVRFYQKVLEFSPNSFRAHNEIGVIYLDEGRYDLALPEFQLAVRNNPYFDQAYDNLGIAYDMKGDYEKAIQSHNKALELNPNNPKAYNNLGNAYNKTNQFDKAITAYQNALRLNPGFKAVYNNLGVIYYKIGDFENAKRYWKKALEIDPNFKMAEDNLRVLDGM